MLLIIFLRFSNLHNDFWEVYDFYHVIFYGQGEVNQYAAGKNNQKQNIKGSVGDTQNPQNSPSYFGDFGK